MRALCPCMAAQVAFVDDCVESESEWIGVWIRLRAASNLMAPLPSPPPVQSCQVRFVYRANIACAWLFYRNPNALHAAYDSLFSPPLSPALRACLCSVTTPKVH